MSKCCRVYCSPVSTTECLKVENLYAYGKMNRRLLAEDMPSKAHTRQGRFLGGISTAAFDAHKQERARVAVERGSDFFGPWRLDSTIAERVFYPLLHGKAAQLIGRSDLLRTHTYVKDFATALIILVNVMKRMAKSGMRRMTNLP